MENHLSGLKVTSREATPSSDSTQLKEKCSIRPILLAAIVAFAAKLFIALNTFGTNDVLTFYIFGGWLSVHGLKWTYQSTILFNHPPLTAWYLGVIYHLHHVPLVQSLGLTFPFLLRVPGIVADFVVVSLLLRANRSGTARQTPFWALLLLALSPLSIMVSGYHGNTDPVMVMFLVLAWYLCTRNRPALAGLALALSVQIKIIPLLLFPIFFLFWMERRNALRFTISFSAVSLILWSEPLLEFPRIFAHNVLSYSSYWGIWGISYLLRLTGKADFSRVSFFDLGTAQNLIILSCKMAIVLVVALLAWRRRKLDDQGLAGSIAYAWIAFFILSPGVCVQYLVWLAPFVLLLSPKLYGWLTVASSLFAFAFYDTISGHLPWFRGVSTNALNRIWAPWSLLPWAVLLGAAFLLWRRDREAVLQDLSLLARTADEASSI